MQYLNKHLLKGWSRCFECCDGSSLFDKGEKNERRARGPWFPPGDRIHIRQRIWTEERLLALRVRTSLERYIPPTLTCKQYPICNDQVISVCVRFYFSFITNPAMHKNCILLIFQHVLKGCTITEFWTITNKAVRFSATSSLNLILYFMKVSIFSFLVYHGDVPQGVRRKSKKGA